MKLSSYFHTSYRIPVVLELPLLLVIYNRNWVWIPFKTNDLPLHCFRLFHDPDVPVLVDVDTGISEDDGKACWVCCRWPWMATHSLHFGSCPCICSVLRASWDAWGQHYIELLTLVCLLVCLCLFVVFTTFFLSLPVGLLVRRTHGLNHVLFCRWLGGWLAQTIVEYCQHSSAAKSRTSLLWPRRPWCSLITIWASVYLCLLSHPCLCMLSCLILFFLENRNLLSFAWNSTAAYSGLVEPDNLMLNVKQTAWLGKCLELNYSCVPW